MFRHLVIVKVENMVTNIAIDLSDIIYSIDKISHTEYYDEEKTLRFYKEYIKYIKEYIKQFEFKKVMALVPVVLKGTKEYRNIQQAYKSLQSLLSKCSYKEFKKLEYPSDKVDMMKVLSRAVIDICDYIWGEAPIGVLEYYTNDYIEED